MQIKQELRKLYKKLRADLSPENKYEMDRLIRKKLISSDLFSNAQTILTYVSSDTEVDTLNIISYCFSVGKKVFVPRCVPCTNIMVFCEISSFSDLEAGSFGIREPLGSIPAAEVIPEASVCLLPGLAYDRNGNRLGFGRGFYDRFLSSYNGLKIGLCYESCICDINFSEKHDIAADLIITDKSMYILK